MLPVPNYNYDVDQLVKLYQDALDKVSKSLDNLDLTTFERANQTAVLKEIQSILNELQTEVLTTSQLVINKAVQDGIIYSLIALNLADTVVEAQGIITFNRMNRELNKAIVADLQTDLLAVTNNVSRKVRSAVRDVSATVLRNSVTQGINGTQTLKREILKGLKDKLSDSLNYGIIDAANRRWKPTTYVDMLVRTKMMEAHKESTINEALSRNVQYAVISKHNAKDACRNWEGKVIKLSRDAEGDFIFYGDLPKNEIFHP